MRTRRNTNMTAEQGISAATDWTLHPAPPVVDLGSLLSDTDPQWLSWTIPWSPESLFKAATHMRWFSPINGTQHPSIMDLWFTPIAPNKSFTNEMLGSLVDQWPEILENYNPESPYITTRLAAATKSGDQTIGTAPLRLSFNFSTLSMAIEVKKVLPDEGVTWLFLRSQSKKVHNGRLDAEVLIFDKDLDLVVVSHHVSQFMPGQRRFVKL